MEITKNEFININNKFDEYKIKEEKAFKYIEGKQKIIVSAPHSVRQIRNGNIKGKDSCTGDNSNFATATIKLLLFI